MQVAFSGAFVTQQTSAAAQTFVPHINEASAPASAPASTGGVKSQEWFEPERQQPATSAAIAPASQIPRPFTHITPPSLPNIGKKASADDGRLSSTGR